jgi:hypothetical protein
VHARIAGLMLCALAASADAAETQRWQVVNANDLKVGHALVTRTVGESSIIDSERIEIRFGKTGRRARYRLHFEIESAPDGSLRRMLREVETAEGNSRVEAVVVGEDLDVSHGSGRTKTTQRIAGAARDLKSDEWARAWLSAVGRGEAREPWKYRTWDAAKLENVTIELSAVPTDPIANVERRVFSSRGTTGSRLRVDAQGNVVREIMALGSFELTRSDATQQEAQAKDQVFDHIAPLLQKSPYRIPARDMDQKIRYRLENHGKTVELPVGAGQRSWIDGDSTWLQVCASCPLDGVELSADERRRALEPTQWLESADPFLLKRSLFFTEDRKDPAAKMLRLTEFVRSHMGTKFDMLGYGTALEALRSRRGDCTEFAVLLAAMGRAAGVPTRIAIGRVYARHFEGYRHVFVPHAWVQAWTGSGWESFDAAIGSFDSTHLAFGVSYDGNPMNHYAAMKLSREMTLTQAARVIPRKVAKD